MDDDVQAVFHRAVATIEPPDPARLIAAGKARGRRLRRWRIAASAGSTITVLAAVVALAVTLIPSGAVRHSGAPALDPSPSKRPSTALHGPQLDHGVATTPQALLQIAIDALPRPGHTSRYAGNYVPGMADTQFVYDDGHGAAQIYVALVTDPNADVDARPCAAGTSGCTVLPDGAHAMFTSYPEYSDNRTPNPTNWRMVLVRPDGVAVEITEFNAPQEKGAALSRAVPPFSRSELTAWADNPKFTAEVTADFAKRTARLFSSRNLDAPPPGAAGKTRLAKERAAKNATTAQRERNCALAKKLHKAPPAYCGGH